MALQLVEEGALDDTLSLLCHVFELANEEQDKLRVRWCGPLWGLKSARHSWCSVGLPQGRAQQPQRAGSRVWASSMACPGQPLEC